MSCENSTTLGGEVIDPILSDSDSPDKSGSQGHLRCSDDSDLVVRKLGLSECLFFGVKF